MRTRLFLVTVLAALAAAGAALAGTGQGAARAGIRYSFLGRLTATPANGAVSISVEGGNRAALRAMLGQPAAQTLAYDERTEFLSWARGIPTVVQPGDLAAGDYVWVHVRAPRGASLAEIERRAAGLVGDHGPTLDRPSQPLYLFRGTLTAVGASSVTLDVRGGNARAMRLLIGQPANQTFTTGDDTIVLSWRGKAPTVVSLSQLGVGERVVVRVRAPRGSTLAQVESTPARHIGEHEPASSS